MSQFRRAQGDVQWAHFCGPPQWLVNGRTRRVRGVARQRGIKYEARAQDAMLAQYPHEYLRSPWIVFRDAVGMQYCQPDGLLIRPHFGLIVIVEYKLSHNIAAWYQLKELYLPVVQRIFSTPDNLWRYAYAEVVQWYDPLVNSHVRTHMCSSLDELHAGEYGIHIWTPSRSR